MNHNSLFVIWPKTTNVALLVFPFSGFLTYFNDDNCRVYGSSFIYGYILFVPVVFMSTVSIVSIHIII